MISAFNGEGERFLFLSILLFERHVASDIAGYLGLEPSGFDPCRRGHSPTCCIIMYHRMYVLIG